MAIALSVAYTPSPTGLAGKLLVEATKQLSAGVNFVGRSSYRQIVVSTTAAASPANILSAYNAKFGTLIAGRKIFVRITQISADGQRSAPLVTSIIVT